MTPPRPWPILGAAARLRCSVFWMMTLAVAASNAPSASGKVLVASTTFGASSAIYEFDDFGNLLGTLDVTSGGPVLFSIATDGSRIVAGHAYNGFREYALDGAFLGQLSDLPTPTEGPVVEFDSRGNMYLLDAGLPRRLNPDGTTSNTFAAPAIEYGIDADAAGNVYISRQSRTEPFGIYKYSSQGAYLNFTAGIRGDVAIDEVGQVLYAGDSTHDGMNPIGRIAAFDISGQSPAFIRHVPAPPYTAGISFDPVTGHLLAANLLGGDAWEITTDGTVVRRYAIPGTNPFDVVAIRVPEISTLGMLVIAAACGPLWRAGAGRNWRRC